LIRNCKEEIKKFKNTSAKIKVSPNILKLITTLVLTSVESTAADVPVSFMGKFIAFYRPVFTDLITGTRFESGS
jgi:hypothetical protein